MLLLNNEVTCDFFIFYFICFLLMENVGKIFLMDIKFFQNFQTLIARKMKT